MAAYDTSTPAGSEAISNGDNRIRELKTQIQTALRGGTTEGLVGVFPGTNSSDPVYEYRGRIGTTASRPAASVDVGLYHNTTKNTIQRCNDSAWVDVATLIPSGTIMVFFQSAVPTGWTQNTSHNDKALRVVSGTGGGSGGAVGFAGLSASSHTLTESQIPSHYHLLVRSDGTPTSLTSSNNIIQQDATLGNSREYSLGASTNSTPDLGRSGTAGSGSGHTHGIDPYYIDVVIGAKD